MKKTPIFLMVLFFLLILIPQVCAQNAPVSPEKAAETRTAFVNYAKRFLGKPYKRGAFGPDSFDCSGLVFTSSRESIGVQLPRMTKALYQFCDIIDESEREVGDLLFFKTTGDGSVSHVGIYLGKGQFLNAASDGPRTGVIISSLSESYWKAHYFKTGRFLPASGLESMKDTSAATDSAAGGAQRTATSAAASGGGFLGKIVLDATLNFDWNLFTVSRFQFTPRGGSTMLHAMYDGRLFKPGIGSMIRVDTEMGVVQLPFVVSLTFGERFRVFFGPVFTFGTPELPGESTAAQASVFPGILGLCWQTPSVGVGKTRVSLQQDVHYTFFKDTDGAALAPGTALVSGLVFSTGVRVTLPLAQVL